MAGHSKWHNIRIRKGKQDAIRGKMFTKLAREIIVAARLGGSDPDANVRLRTAIAKAKENSLPKDNIERAIAKGSGDLEGENYEEIVYEGMAPGGVGVIVEVYSENRNRTVADLRHAFTKCGGSLTENGSVSWQFMRAGKIQVVGPADEEELTLAALDAGAEDVQANDDGFEVTAPMEMAHACSAELEKAGFTISQVEILWTPTNMAEPSEEDLGKVLRLLDMLDDLDDVKETYINAEFPEAMLQEA